VHSRNVVEAKFHSASAAKEREQAMDYEPRFEDAIIRLKAEERYRIFANLERDASRFPMAMWRPRGEEDAPREVTVWCSNDCLGMGGHPEVIEASVRAARAHGAGAGVTRNISGTHHPIVRLEAELADLHGKAAALVFTSGWISNLAGISTIASLLPDCLILSDALNHNSMIEGSSARAARRRFGATTTPPISRSCSPPNLSSGPSSWCSRASIRWTATSRQSPRSSSSPRNTTP